VPDAEPVDKYSIADGEDRDDEAAFWEGFFERLKPLKEASDRAREGFTSSFVGEGLSIPLHNSLTTPATLPGELRAGQSSSLTPRSSGARPASSSCFCC